MIRFIRANMVTWAGVLLAIAPLRGENYANDDRASPPALSENDRQSILVLQDGGVLIGQIAREGDRYFVTTARGEMQVAAANVMLKCRSLDEAYIQKREQLTRPTADAHLALAEWCLRYNLVAQAGRELADARSLEPLHARLALLDRRLALTCGAPQEPAPADSEAKPQPEPPAAVKSDQSLTRELPADVVRRFTRRVQPILVNNCTNSGCHARGGRERFQLDRSLLHGQANRRSTMHNLAATLALVDRSQPELSPLLTTPRQTHGGMEGPVFGLRHETAFRHLVEWTALVAQSGADEQDIPAGEADAAAAGALHSRLVSPVLHVAQQAKAPRIDNDVEPAAYAPERTRPRFGAEIQKWEPRDPFDPEIFNRRQRAAQRPMAEAAQMNVDQESR